MCILLYNYILCIFNCGKMAATKITTVFDLISEHALISEPPLFFLIKKKNLNFFFFFFKSFFERSCHHYKRSLTCNDLRK